MIGKIVLVVFAILFGSFRGEAKKLEDNSGDLPPKSSLEPNFDDPYVPSPAGFGIKNVKRIKVIRTPDRRNFNIPLVDQRWEAVPGTVPDPNPAKFNGTVLPSSPGINYYYTRAYPYGRYANGRF